MRKHFSILAVSLLALTACNMTGTVSEEGADSSAVASDAAASSAASSESAGTGVEAALEAWAPSLVWSDAVRGTNDGAITIDAEHVISAGAIQAGAMMTPITAEQYLTIFQDAPSRAALDAALEADGWAPLASLDADGATGTQWGYTKTDAEGTRFVMVSANGTDCIGAPATCTTYMAKVTVTDALVQGDDL